MGAWHHIEIKVGPYTWNIEPGDEGQLGDVLAGLKVSTNWSTDHPVQGTPGPWDCSFGIIVDDLDDLADVDLGTRVSVMAFLDEEAASFVGRDGVDYLRPPLVQFLGTVAELSASPDAKGRTVVTVMCTDRLVDLANMTVGELPFPNELLVSRFERLWQDGPGQAKNGGYVMPVGDFLYGNMAAREAQATDALELIQYTLANQVDHDIPLAHFLCLNPGLETDPVTFEVLGFGRDLDPARPFTIMYSYKEPVAGNHLSPFDLPMVFVDGPDGWTVEVDPINVELVVPAADVLLDTTYSKVKSTQVDRTVVALPDDLGSWTQQWLPGVPIEWRFDGEQTTLATARDVALYALPPRNAKSWGNDKLTIIDLPDETPMAWFAHWYQANALNPRQPVVIDGVVPEQNPSRRPWLAGMLANATIVFDDGGWTIELELRADLPRPYTDYHDDENLDGVYEPYLSPRNMKWNHNELSDNAATFETDASAWTTGGSVPPAIAASAVSPIAGTKSLLITWGAGGSLPLVQITKPLLDGRQYTFSARIQRVSGPQVVLCVPGANGGVGVFSPASTVAVGGIETLSVTFTAREDGIGDLLQIWPVGAPAAGNQTRVDEVKVEGGPVRRSFDGNTNPEATITPLDLDPKLTPYDLRLVRRPA